MTVNINESCRSIQGLDRKSRYFSDLDILVYVCIGIMFYMLSVSLLYVRVVFPCLCNNSASGVNTLKERRGGGGLLQCVKLTLKIIFYQKLYY